MRNQGLDWPLLDHPTFGDWRNRRRYGVIEPTIADQYGYHAVPALLGPVTVYNERVRRDNALSAAQRTAAVTPGSGCAARATAQMQSNDQVSDYELASQLSAQSLDLALGRPAVVGALAAWRSCMSSAGLYYPDPHAAAADPRWAGDGATAAEKTVARTDVRCQERTGLVGAWHDADVAVQEEMVRAHLGYFSTLAQGKAALLGAARALLEAE